MTLKSPFNHEERKYMETYKEFEIRVKKNFENHVATMKDNGEVKILDWQNPPSCIYAMQFMIRGRHLFVTGDCRNAIYSWSDYIDFDFLRTCDIDYFYSKLNSLESPRPREWDNEKAMNSLKEFLESSGFSDNDEILEEASGASFSNSDWTSFLDEHSELDGLYNAGNTIPLLVKYHLAGLHLAIENWQNNTKK